MTFGEFFCDATGFQPYEWQITVATEGLNGILPVPTGLGKTEGVVLAWAWRFLTLDDEPRHLVYCLPMRTLVRQTVERLESCFQALKAKRSLDIHVYQLMGGAIDEEWARQPEKPWVLVGTQDQLLSRALNRGYAMSRFEWPVHFGLLNNDCRWVVDETQLLGPGLWTTAQLDWMRQKRFPCLKPCLTTWMSATVGTGFLATTDRARDKVDHVPVPDLRFDDPQPEMRRRRQAQRLVEWLDLGTGRSAGTAVADRVVAAHQAGTLSLVVCNTVDTAREVFQALPDSSPKILLTSRFRRVDRDEHEQRLLEFEKRRRDRDGEPIDDDAGLICVSTQVVEAGVDISAHELWSELAPWPSVIQRLGRLNRDGRDQDAKAWFWETPAKDQSMKSSERIGPYDKDDIAQAKKLVDALILLSGRPFADALRLLEQAHQNEVVLALQPKPAPLPRALDVHGLFSTERDVHGGFTDVSAFVRGTDPDADLTVFWRDWEQGERGKAPPHGDDLDGPPFDLRDEGCPVPFFRLQAFLEAPRAPAWTWNDEDDAWQRVWPNDLRPGMVVMLHRDVGGYDARLGWTGDKNDVLGDVPRAGRGRALRDDERTETGSWVPVEVHLADARVEATRLCEAVGVDEPLRTAVIEAAALHDLGKAHPQWQHALPAVRAPSEGPWAKCPRVVAVDARPADAAAVRREVAKRLVTALALPDETRHRGREECVRLRWAVTAKLKREEVEQLKKLDGVRWAGYVPFRPGMRHEAASALAMWTRYRERRASYPALSVYLVAAHHGKVRTVLRATTDGGADVFGVSSDSAALDVSGEQWPLDFSVAKDGAEGEWRDGVFVLTGHGWTGLVADLFGPWRADDRTEVAVVPQDEPRRLGPFALAYLEALVRVADWRASENPSKRACCPTRCAVTSSPEQLAALPIPGLPPDSLGNYLASLGLLRLLARTRPAVRIAWHEDILHVVGGPNDLREVVDALVDIAAKGAWTPYERDWADAQKKSTKAKSGAPLALWQASAEESTLELIRAHAVPAASVSFNPLLGSGGNAGRRDFSKGWKQATTELTRASSTQTKPKKTKTAKASIPDPTKELEALLLGQPATWLLEKLNAASWFSDANKLYNSGQAPFREGRLSPWAMALACEGLPFLAGGASRRLGAHARAVGAFPFVTDAAAPLTSGEAGRDSGEFWAPVWNRPMTLPEVRALFSRGRAEVRGHGALTPSAFVTAIMRRGVDAGIIEFRRFVLGSTTSANTFEPRFEGTFRLSPSPDASESSPRPEPAAAATSLQRVLDLADRLPRDQKKGQRWRFVGLRGPIEKAMLQAAREPANPGTACGLLDAVVVALDRVDRNRSFRERRVSWKPLPLEWLPALFGTNPSVIEARLALALVSGFPAERPFTLYRFGVEKRPGRFEHPTSPPERWVWGPGPLARLLSKVLLRRTLDGESAHDEEAPARQGIPATLADVSRWLDGSVDEALLAQWISRLALFDWDFISNDVRAALAPPHKATVPVDGALALFGLFSPLFNLRSLCWRDGPVVRDLLDRESGTRTPGAARALTSLVQRGQIELAVRLAASRYAMANAPLIRTAVPWDIHDPDRLLASILVSIADDERTALIERWLRPQRQKGEPAHA